MILTLAEWQKTKKNINDLILQASVKDGSDSWTPFPIGFCWQYVKETDKVKIQFGSHDNLVLSAMNTNTDLQRRPNGINRQSIEKTLKLNGIQNSFLDSKNYFSILPSYKFVISPEGNGIDCHRHYEALLAGCIPIIEFNDQIQEKYKDLPILYTKDYSEINPESLNDIYKNMLDKTYDFSRLFKSYYSLEDQKKINDYGQYWIQKWNIKYTPESYFNSIFGQPLVWITLINYGYINYTKNFLKSMEINSCRFKLIVYCLDKKTMEELKDYDNALCFDASYFTREDISSDLSDFSSINFKKICFLKLDAIKYTLELCNKYGIWAVGYIDTDVILFKNPTDIIIRTMVSDKNISVIGQCDEDFYKHKCSNPRGCPHMCAGIMVFRTGSIDFSIFNYSNEDIEMYNNNDQEYLNSYIFIKHNIQRITIPKDVFLNGAYPGIKENLIIPETACLIHYNYMIGSEKEFFMKKNGMWYL